MNFTKLLLWGGIGYLGYKMVKGGNVLPGDCTIEQRRVLAGIYGMPLENLGVRTPTANEGAQGGVVIYDTRNGAAMMHVLDGDCSRATTQASTAVAQAAGNKTFATTPYNGSLYVVS